MPCFDEPGARPVAAGGAIPAQALWFLKAVTTTVLVAAVNGTLDLHQLARDELIRRGLDPAGNWVGPSRARELHNHHSA